MELKAQRSILTQSACCSRLLSNSLLCFTAVFVFVGFEEFSWDRELQPQPTRPVPAKNESTEVQVLGSRKIGGWSEKEEAGLRGPDSI